MKHINTVYVPAHINRYGRLRPAAIRVTTPGRKIRLTVWYDDTMSLLMNHLFAAQRFCEKTGFTKCATLPRAYGPGKYRHTLT